MGKPIAVLFLMIAVAAVYAVFQQPGNWLDIEDVVRLWEDSSNPGHLAQAHVSLEAQCESCHTALLGPDPAKCAACHADDRGLLERQSTAFHANIRTCRECHREHLGRQYVSRRMDHPALADIGERGIPRNKPPLLQHWFSGVLNQPQAEGRSDNPLIRAEEASLVCAACHSRRDRHQGQFGADCASCHATASWRIPRYVHPSANSTDCAQCHLEPPSHRMMHFEMVSKTVAAQMHADVRQCFLCHQTTSWNDIKGVGWYKHH